MNQRELETFKTKLKWNIYNEKFKEITSFAYSSFIFRFKITSQAVQEEFCNFVCDTETLLPWDICNFFFKRDIKFSIGFRYVKGMGVKGNWVLFKCFLYLKKAIVRLTIKKFFHAFVIIPSAEKKMINGKERRELMIKLINRKTRTIYFIQADSNIWWKPRRIINHSEKVSMASIGWLFVQVGKAKIMFTEDENNENSGENSENRGDQ